MIGGGRIAAGRTIERRVGELRFEREDRAAVGFRLCRRCLQHPEHVLYVAEIFLFQLQRSRIGLQVIVAVGQAESALIDVGDLPGRIAQVGSRAEPEEHVDADALQVRHERRQVIDPRERGDLRKICREAPLALRLDAGLVHARGVVIARLLPHDVGRRRLENASQNCKILILELIETSPALPIGRHRIRRHPAAAGELVKVGAGIDAPIERQELDACGRGGGRPRGRHR